MGETMQGIHQCYVRVANNGVNALRQCLLHSGPAVPCCLSEIRLFSTLSRVDIPVSQVSRLTAARGYLNPPRSILNRSATAILSTPPVRSALFKPENSFASKTHSLGKSAHDTISIFFFFYLLALSNFNGTMQKYRCYSTPSRKKHITR